MLDCHFCRIVEERTSDLPEDQILIEGPNFYVKPALGHFTEGYLLVNAKRHVQSFSFLGRSALEELDALRENVAASLRALYKMPVIAFEHGEVGSEFHPGCCFEHAHLHVLPVDLENALAFDFGFPRQQLSSLTDLRVYSLEQTPYLLTIDTNNRILVHGVERNLPSQFLRKEICARLGTPDVWDWALFPFRERIQSFLSKYRNVRASI